MKLIINGEDKNFEESHTVESLLTAMGLDHRVIIVEKNGEILDRNVYSDISVKDGDKFELIRFMGGG